MFNLGKPKFRIVRWQELYAPNPAMLRLRLEREGFRVSQWGDSPGAIFPNYKHPKLQSHWVISGSLEFTISGEIYTLEVGDRSFLAAETYQSMRIVSEDFAIYLVGEKITEARA